MRLLLLPFLCCFILVTASAQDGYRIEVEIDGYNEQELYLGEHFGQKQYLKDTAYVNDEGRFVFTGEEPLPGGVYLVVMAPDNNYFQLLITEGEQRFQLKTNVANPTLATEFENAPDNTLFYEYMRFLETKKPEADKLAKAMETAAGEEKEKLQAQREKLDAEVSGYQAKLIEQNPGTLTAAIIQANLPLLPPEFEGSEEEVQRKRWMYTRQHYFDNIDLGDPRMLRTPFLFQRIDYYVNKLQIQHPDTLSAAIDEVLAQLKPAEESFQYYLIHFLNEYARSKIVGMDAVYVHLVNKYYAQGLAPWTEEEQLEKIIDNAKSLEPLLIGKTAPNIRLETRDGKPVYLHEVKSPYTVLYFWRYDCGHCKKSSPMMKEFYDEFKDKGVELVAVCTKFTDEIEGCWEYIDENEIGDWMHMVDTYHQSRYMKVYDIKSTPQIYILDKDKEILSKKIGAEQLAEVMERIMEMDQQKASGEEDSNQGK